MNENKVIEQKLEILIQKINKLSDNQKRTDNKLSDILDYISNIDSKISMLDTALSVILD